MIGVGDEVICIQDQGPAPLGPCDLPRFGEKYIVTGVYRAKYGLGCTLHGMNHRPYRGYLLFVHDPFHPSIKRGWYYAKVEPTQAEKDRAYYERRILELGL